MCQDVLLHILPIKWQEVSYLFTPIEIHIVEYFSCHFVCLCSWELEGKTAISIEINFYKSLWRQVLTQSSTCLRP